MANMIHNYNFKDYKDRQKFYRSKLWYEAREYKIKMNPICEECLKKGIITPAYAVDHIIALKDSPELYITLTNLRSLCKSCHSKKTAEEMGWKKEYDGKLLNNENNNFGGLTFKR
jgi:5-methylcytosine-specific restriction endonuclease McrA